MAPAARQTARLHALLFVLGAIGGGALQRAPPGAADRGGTVGLAWRRAARLRARAPAAVRCAAGGADQDDARMGGAPLPPPAADAHLPFGPLPGAEPIRKAMRSPQFELLVACFVLLSVIGYGLGTLPAGALTGAQRELLGRAEDATTGLFALEYLLRWWSRSLRPGYLARPLMVIDLVSILPALLALLGTPAGGAPAHAVGGRGSWAFLRVLRVLKLQRYVRDEPSFAKLRLALGLAPAGAAARRTDLPLARVVLTLLTLLLITAGFLYEAEPQVDNYFSALYLSLTTLTTIGTISPQTPAGTLVVSGSVLAGLAIVPLQLSRLADAFAAAPGAVAMMGDDDDELEPAADGTCAACGAGGHRRDANFCYACGTAFLGTGPAPMGAEVGAADRSDGDSVSASAARGGDAADAARVEPAAASSPPPAAAAPSSQQASESQTQTQTRSEGSDYGSDDSALHEP